MVFTFSPHPMFVFQRKEDFALIVDPSEKKFQMEQMGIDIYIEYPFDMNFAAMDPEDFAVKLISEMPGAGGRGGLPLWQGRGRQL